LILDRGTAVALSGARSTRPFHEIRRATQNPGRVLHLRWNFVFQRPQHLLSRLAAHYRVLFIEEPVHDSGAPRLEVSTGRSGRLDRPAAHAVRLGGLRRRPVGVSRPMVADLLASQNIDRYIVWFYTPMAVPCWRGCGRSRSSTTAWTSCRRSPVRRRSCASAKRN
jgi:hypothetical protein